MSTGDPYFPPGKFSEDPFLYMGPIRRVNLNPDGTLTDLDTGLPVEVPPSREMTDQEIEDAALSDPDNLPLTEDDFRRMRRRQR